MSAIDPAPADRHVRERWRVLFGLERWLERPMAWLGVVWLALLVVELTRGLSGPLALLGTVIWVAFVLDFTLRLVLAPDRRRYLARNWLTALSLLVPALRAFRALRVARALRVVRGSRLVKVIGSLNRAMRAIGHGMRRRRLGYVILLTSAVTVAGAAGMFALEREHTAGLDTFGEALWWTAMIMTTLGSERWPQTPEGRILCLLLALFAFAVFGYVTASLATYLVGRDAAARDGDLAGASDVRLLRQEIGALRDDLSRLALASASRGGSTHG
jgi:voltage-gated potassium channel